MNHKKLLKLESRFNLGTDVHVHDLKVNLDLNLLPNVCEKNAIRRPSELIVVIWSLCCQCLMEPLDRNPVAYLSGNAILT